MPAEFLLFSCHLSMAQYFLTRVAYSAFHGLLFHTPCSAAIILCQWVTFLWAYYAVVLLGKWHVYNMKSVAKKKLLDMSDEWEGQIKMFMLDLVIDIPKKKWLTKTEKMDPLTNNNGTCI